MKKSVHSSTSQSPDRCEKTTKALVYYLCSLDRRMMDCVEFKQKIEIQQFFDRETII